MEVPFLQSLFVGSVCAVPVAKAGFIGSHQPFIVQTHEDRNLTILLPNLLNNLAHGTQCWRGVVVGLKLLVQFRPNGCEGWIQSDRHGDVEVLPKPIQMQDGLHRFRHRFFIGHPSSGLEHDVLIQEDGVFGFFDCICAQGEEFLNFFFRIPLEKHSIAEIRVLSFIAARELQLDEVWI